MKNKIACWRMMWSTDNCKSHGYCCKKREKNVEGVKLLDCKPIVVIQSLLEVGIQLPLFALIFLKFVMALLLFYKLFSLLNELLNQEHILPPLMCFH